MIPRTSLFIRASAISIAALALSVDASAQTRFFAGAMGGITTLSADGTSNVQPPALTSSSYKPANGPTANAFAGIHWNGYLSSQLDYLWNQNRVNLTALNAAPLAYYQQNFSTRQNSALASMLLYFRPLRSAIRPYLSTGIGVVILSASPDGPATFSGLAPPALFKSSNFAFHVTVGIDVRVRENWYLRYSFAETTSANPISARLTPPGTRRLASFRNLIGFVRYF